MREEIQILPPKEFTERAESEVLKIMSELKKPSHAGFYPTMHEANGVSELDWVDVTNNDFTFIIGWSRWKSTLYVKKGSGTIKTYYPYTDPPYTPWKVINELEYSFIDANGGVYWLNKESNKQYTSSEIANECLDWLRSTKIESGKPQQRKVATDFFL
jgi:hypothetical protein